MTAGERHRREGPLSANEKTYQCQFVARRRHCHGHRITRILIPSCSYSSCKMRCPLCQIGCLWRTPCPIHTFCAHALPTSSCSYRSQSGALGSGFILGQRRVGKSVRITVNHLVTHIIAREGTKLVCRGSHLDRGQGSIEYTCGGNRIPRYTENDGARRWNIPKARGSVRRLLLRCNYTLIPLKSR